MEALLKVATPKKYKGKTPICNFQDDMSIMYIVVSGQVAIMIKDHECDCEYENLVVGPGEFFGGLGLIKDKMRLMRAITLTDSVILETDLERVKAYQKGHDDGSRVYLDLMKRSHTFNKKVSAACKSPGCEEGVGEAGVGSSGVEVLNENSNGNGSNSIFLFDSKYANMKATDLQKTMVMKKTFKCPICGESFKTDVVRGTKVKFVKQGDLFFSEFEDIDQLWYDVVICPTCSYAERQQTFEAEVKYNVAKIRKGLKEITGNFIVGYSDTRTAEEVMNGFLLYQQCLELKGADQRQMARVYLLAYEMLRRLGDDEEAVVYRDKAFEFYQGMFKSGILDVSDTQMQQLYIILGKLHEHRGEYDEARSEYRKSKMVRGDIDPKFSEMAENYLIDLHDMGV